MQKQTQRALLWAMAGLGVGAAAVSVLLRVCLMPTLRDTETGLFSSGTVVVAVMLLSLVALAALSFTQPKQRVELLRPVAPRVGVVALLSGVVLALYGVWDIWRWLATDRMPAPQTVVTGHIGMAALVLQLVFAVLGGAALVRWGLLLVAEGATRRGMAGWSMLAPVLWMWFRLARYEMSYVSTVRLSESFFDFGMFILELLFLFKLARFTAGVGKTWVGSLQFFAAATALFALSAPLTRLIMYLLGDSEAFLASELAGAGDMAVGLLAAAVSFGLAATPEEPVAAPDAGEQPYGEPVSSSEAGESPAEDFSSFDFISEE